MVCLHCQEMVKELGRASGDPLRPDHNILVRHTKGQPCRIDGPLICLEMSALLYRNTLNVSKSPIEIVELKP